MRRIARSRTRMFRWSTRSLVRVALAEGYSERGWRAIHALHLRGTPRTLELAVALGRSSSSRKRRLALDIVAQLFIPSSSSQQTYEPYAPATLKALMLSGLDDPHRDVVASAVSGLGHRPNSDALDRLVRLGTDVSSEMRWHVAVTLASYCEHAAIDTLMRLALDPDGDVRDWATFGLGTRSDVDSHELRELFWKNAHDPHRAVCGEAMVALARRSDPRAVTLLRSRLANDCRVYELEAATELRSSDLLEALESLRDSADRTRDLDSYWYGRLLDAIAACSPPAGADTAE